MLLRTGWEQYGHGLSCWPRESLFPEVLDALLFFSYNGGSSGRLIQGP